MNHLIGVAGGKLGGGAAIDGWLVLGAAFVSIVRGTSIFGGSRQILGLARSLIKSDFTFLVVASTSAEAISMPSLFGHQLKKYRAK